MSILIKNSEVYFENKLSKKDVYIDDNGIVTVADSMDVPGAREVIDGKDYLITPGLIDAHVHLREPGFEYKETIKTGTMAAARGGYTTVCCMPNLNPVPDTVEHMMLLKNIIDRDAVIHVIPYASITRGQKGTGEIVNMEALAPYTVGFSDDGKGVQEEDTMLEAMKEAAFVNRMIVAHCEDESKLVKGGAVQEGEVAEKFHVPGISSESEYAQIERDCRLAKATGAQYHVCHISCKESVDIIRKAKAEGVNVSCEVTPHHLLLCQDDITSDDGKFKMNPPLRSAEDHQALIDGLLDGTIDIISTDHAPHSAEEKAKGLAKSSFGIVGSENAFELIYTNLVKTGVITLEKCIELMSCRPADIFGIDGGQIEQGCKATLSVFDINHKTVIDPSKFASKGKSTPFEGYEVFGRCLMTVVNGKIVYREGI